MRKRAVRAPAKQCSYGSHQGSVLGKVLLFFLGYSACVCVVAVCEIQVRFERVRVEEEETLRGCSANNLQDLDRYGGQDARHTWHGRVPIRGFGFWMHAYVVLDQIVNSAI
jgi:hypothetical protein